MFLNKTIRLICVLKISLILIMFEKKLCFKFINVLKNTSVVIPFYPTTFLSRNEFLCHGSSHPQLDVF